MRRPFGVLLAGSVGLVVALAAPAAATHLPTHECPDDAVRVGTACIDKFEASVWKISGSPLTNAQQRVISKIRAGTVTLANLMAIGATQLGLAQDDLATAGCPLSGNGCTDVYAVSIAGVMPAGHIAWFQASAAARNSFKRLPSNAEWQAAALGTPDPGTDDGTTDCNVVGPWGIVNTGSRSKCVSDAGVFDMVGNLMEWVADWVPQSTACPGWDAFSTDSMCLGGARTDAGPGAGPGALVRGGNDNDSGAGVFSIFALYPLFHGGDIGFHAAR